MYNTARILNIPVHSSQDLSNTLTVEFSVYRNVNFVQMFYIVLDDPEVTANLYCNFAYLYWKGWRDLQYIFAVSYGPPSTLGSTGFLSVCPYECEYTDVM